MDLEMIRLSDVSQENDRCHMIALTWNLNNDTGLPWWLSGKDVTCRCRGQGFDLLSGNIHMPWGN